MFDGYRLQPTAAVSIVWTISPTPLSGSREPSNHDRLWPSFSLQRCPSGRSCCAAALSGSCLRSLATFFVGTSTSGARACTSWCSWPMLPATMQGTTRRSETPDAACDAGRLELLEGLARLPLRACVALSQGPPEVVIKYGKLMHKVGEIRVAPPESDGNWSVSGATLALAAAASLACRRRSSNPGSARERSAAPAPRLGATTGRGNPPAKRKIPMTNGEVFA